MSTRTRKASLGFVSSIFQYLILGLFQAYLSPLILKIAGQQVLGTYSIVMQIIGYSLLLDLGLSNALVRNLSQTFNLTGKSDLFIKYINVGRFFLFATNFASALFIFAIAYNLNRLVSDDLTFIYEAKLGLYCLAIWTFIRSPLLIYNHALLASQNMTILNILGIITSLIRLLLSFLFVYMKQGLIGLIFANIIAEFIGVISNYILFHKKYNNIYMVWRKPDKKIIKQLLPFGLKYWGINLSIILSVGSDSIILGYIYGSVIAGIYYTTKIPTFLLIQLIFKLADNSGPAINELFFAGKHESVKNAYFKIIRYSLFTALACSIGIIFYNKYVISFWIGEKQYAGNIMSIGLAIYLFTQVINHVNALIVLANGEISRWTYLSIISSFLSFILSSLLAKYYGFQWVMIAIAVMDLPVFFYLWKKSLTILNIDFSDISINVIIPAFKISSIILILILVIDTFFLPVTVFSLILKFFFFSFFFISLVYIIALDNEEKHKITLFLRRIF